MSTVPEETAPISPDPNADLAHTAGGEASPVTKANSLGLWLRDLLISAAASILIITFLYQPVRVEGTSMLPRLENRDRLFINKFVYHIEAIHRGDIVVFHYPLDPSKSYIKRVIAVPGDRIHIVRGQVWLNGKLLREQEVHTELFAKALSDKDELASKCE